MTTDPRHWYVLHVKPGAELKVRSALYRLGHSPLVPTEMRRSRINPETGHRSKTNKAHPFPIFARYVFFAFSEGAQWEDLSSVEPKPVRAISFDGEPAKLSAADVEYIANLKAVPLPADADKIAAGVLARIVGGPLALKPTQVKVESVSDGFASADVTMFGSTRRVLIPVDQLEAA